MPRFLFRIDVSPSAGTGHLRRCLTLAQELKEKGAEIFFACRLESFDIEKYMMHIPSGWEAYDWSLTPEEDARKVVHSSKKHQADTVIIDHYRADEAYQNILYESGIKWLQFDGAARYPIWADWVLNMSPTASENLYEKFKPRKDICFLLGPRYALLRREFMQWRFPARQNRPVGRILLTFGGGDDRGATIFCLKAIQSLLEDLELVVLLSSSNPKKKDIVTWCKESRANIKIVMDAEETAPYMVSTDLAITAGGMTVFELAALGVPAIILQTADNQVPIARAWQQCGYGVDVGHLERLHSEDLQREIILLMQDVGRRETMTTAGKAMVDGLGARRVAQALLSRDMNEME
jgi:UDP-2,4-diacetamido-2,4,6-trideoxy-beta-L-altropyranose hydrolase